MTKDWIGRAIQVAMLNENQLTELQRRENERGYLIPNWNIQTLFGLKTIKENANLNDDDQEGLFRYLARIQSEIEQMGLKGSKFDENTFYFDWCHKFDWNVMNSKENIIWEHSSPRSNLLSRVKRSVALAMMGLLLVR